MAQKPTYHFTLILFPLTMLSTGLVYWYGHSHGIVQAWVIAVSFVALLTFGYDKAIAGSRRLRVPEKIFIALSLAGGSLGVLVGMRLFHHKTCKTQFISKLWPVLSLQLLATLIYHLFIAPVLIYG